MPPRSVTEPLMRMFLDVAQWDQEMGKMMTDHEPECFWGPNGTLPCKVCDAIRAANERYLIETHDPEGVIYARGITNATRRIREGVLDYYRQAPMAAAPVLRIIDKETS
jgi:hypothetical protein